MGRKGEFYAFAPVARIACVAAGCLVLAQCSGSPSSKVDSKYGVSASPRVVQPGEPVPKGGGVHRVGKPYVVAGRTYVPRVDRNYSAEGLASWYGADFHGRLTANGEVYDMHAISAAHPTLPIPSYVRVTNLSNGRSIVARVNDRGPFHKNRVLDASARTAKLLGFHDRGLTRVRVEYVGTAPLEGSDDRMLMATLRTHGPAPAPGVMLASTRPLEPRPVDAPSELTAAARVEKSMGPKPAMAWVTGPPGIPASGVLGAPEAVSAYAPGARAADGAVISGRGLY